MILKSIYIAIEEWGDKKGRYTGNAVFASGVGELKVNLTPETSDKVLAVLAEQLVVSAQEAAKIMTSQVIATATTNQLTYEQENV